MCIYLVLWFSLLLLLLLRLLRCIVCFVVWLLLVLILRREVFVGTFLIYTRCFCRKSLEIIHEVVIWVKVKIKKNTLLLILYFARHNLKKYKKLAKNLKNSRRHKNQCTRLVFLWLFKKNCLRFFRKKPVKTGQNFSRVKTNITFFPILQFWYKLKTKLRKERRKTHQKMYLKNTYHQNYWENIGLQRLLLPFRSSVTRTK